MSGNVFKDFEKKPLTQRINLEDVDSTIEWLEQITNIPHKNFKLGTTGKKSSSGDLDIAIDDATVSKNDFIDTLTKWCTDNNKNPKDWIRKSGISVHFKTPINGDESQGYVQTDFMFGDPKWMKWSMQGSTEKSEFKGAHRHIMMASIAKAQGMKWSFQKGLMDRETNEVISRNPKEIAVKLLGAEALPKHLASVETIWDYIKNRPDADTLTADARDTFARENLFLPENKQINQLKQLAGT